MADARLEKSLDDLINETRKVSRPKGIRVGSTKAAANKSSKGGGKGVSGKSGAKPARRAPIDLGIKGKKISKPSRDARGPAWPGVLGGPWGLMPPPGFMPPPGMFPPGMFPPGAFPGGQISHPTRGRRADTAPGEKRFVKRDPDSVSKWTHDMYTPNQGGPAKRAPKATPIGTTLRVHNLHHNVSEADIAELFGTVGPLVSHEINYDDSGRSLGSATVVFQHRQHAIDAIDKYNKIALDGKKLEIELVEVEVVARLSSGIRVTQEAGSSLGARISRATGSGSRGSAGAGASRLLHSALPRGMGGDSMPMAPAPRRPVGGSRIRSSVVVNDDMQE